MRQIIVSAVRGVKRPVKVAQAPASRESVVWCEHSAAFCRKMSDSTHEKKICHPQ